MKLSDHLFREMFGDKEWYAPAFWLMDVIEKEESFEMAQGTQGVVIPERAFAMRTLRELESANRHIALNEKIRHPHAGAILRSGFTLPGMS